MRQAIKNNGKTVSAWELGAGTEMEAALINDGRIRRRSEGAYEIFSREAVNGGGELAQVGDYIKLDGDGYPYPNDRAFFLANHRIVDGDTYEQLPKPLDAWMAEDGMCPEIVYLIREKGLVIDNTTWEKTFTAPLWGTMESAAGDAVVVFYSITRDADGSIIDADFNFVERGIFDRTYTWIA